MRIPNHVGIIPDGNRRWAVNAGLMKQDGYGYGLDPGLSFLRLARDYGIRELTYYGFTTDNCKRPGEQIDAFVKACVDAVRLIENENVSLLVVGNTDSQMFPDALLKYTRRIDKDNERLKVNFLVNYGWEWDLSDIDCMSRNRKKITDCLKTKDISRVDLIIRWGGRRRLSGFLPVQSVYADFYTIDDFWPDFKPEHFYSAMEWYCSQDVTLGG
jgi:undecaprenyl diphosphate synthase